MIAFLLILLFVVPVTCLVPGTGLAGAPGPGAPIVLVDVASERGLDFTAVLGESFDLASTSAARVSQLAFGTGVAVGDYDGDGDLDIYALAQLGHPNVLFRNDLETGKPGFTDVTPPLLADLGLSRSAAFADLDRDGDLDLVLVNDDDGAPETPPSRIFRNQGGVFSDATEGSGFRPVGFLRCGLALGDPDGDGLLDLYVTNWGFAQAGEPRLPGSNRLYRNLGGLAFEDVTEDVGLGFLARDSFSAVFADFDDDRFLDLFVAVDHTRDEYFAGIPSGFEERTELVGTTHLANDMGVAAADFDDDDDLDLFLTNITDTQDGVYGCGNGSFPPPQACNALYVNQFSQEGAVRFEEEAEARGVGDTYWGWGTQFADLDNDRDLDLVAVTGLDLFIETFGPGGSGLLETPSVLLVQSEGSFTRQFGTGLDAPDDSRALVALDYDRDGDQDLLVSNVDQPMRLFENRSPSRHWLGVDLGVATSAASARVYVSAGSQTQRRDVIYGRSFLAGTPAEVHFGLGDLEWVDEVRVVWSDGAELSLHDVAADQLLRVPEPDPETLGLAALLGALVLSARSRQIA